MGDNVLKSFVDKLLSEDIEEEKFEQYIDLFSRFLGYVNADYKYNGTYLSQYITDFQRIYQMLKKKNEIYWKIFTKLIKIGKVFELVIDRFFYIKFSMRPEIEQEYIGFDKDKIISNIVEIRFTTEYKDNEYTFCKEYKDIDNKLSERVCKDVKEFINTKGIGG